MGDKKGLAAYLAGLAALLAASHGVEGAQRASALVGAVDSLLEATGSTLARIERDAYQQAATISRKALGDHDFEANQKQGRAMSMDQAIQYALGES